MRLAALVFSAGLLPAQISVPRASVEIAVAGVFPVGGFQAESYSSGSGLRVGGELRLHRYVAVEAGWTDAWMASNYNCSRFGCSYSRLQNRLLDAGLRGVVPLSGGKVELSVGMGGGYIWFDPASGDDAYYNSALFQYSGRAAFALDHRRRWRIHFTVRTWRDLGRPIQQWLSTAAGVSYAFGHVR